MVAPRLNRYYDRLKPYYRLDGEIMSNEEGEALSKDSTLIFESRFESGNLRKALKVGPYEYDLFL
jgi:hypothetical protein